MEFIAAAGRIGFLPRPRIPPCFIAAHIFKADAIDRAHCYAQLAACADRLDHGVHHFIAAQYRIGWANRQAQGAADTPSFVDHGHVARSFQAVSRVQGRSWLTGDGSKTQNAAKAAGRALVYLGSTSRNRLGISSAVRVAAARTLGLGQRRIDAVGECFLVRVGHPCIVPLYLLRATLVEARLATGLVTRLATALAAKLVVAIFLGAGNLGKDGADGIFEAL